MKKAKSLWRCSECGKSSAKWSGQCPFCKAWNTLTEEAQAVSKNFTKAQVRQTSPIVAPSNFRKNRLSSGIAEFDRVLGGGFLSDSISLLVGSPGIGKSTLILQAALKIAAQNKKVLIVSGEESAEQISARAHRLSKKTDGVEILNEYYIENALATAESFAPDFLVIDSVQTISSAEIMSNSGAVPQIRAVTEKLMQFAKTKNIPCVLIGHVTKGGEMAGPQLLAHLVDVVLIIEGDQNHEFRLLKASKNRFGNAQEVGVFEMLENGLVEVKNPSQAFLTGRLEKAVGSVIFPTLEGSRSFLVEVQSLTATTRFGLPKRSGSGVNMARLSLILAVLQNHARLNFENKDVFANVVGGFQISEPAADLALALALASSSKKKSLPDTLTACGEIGLSGEIRAVSHLEKRLQEAKKLGFTQAIVPQSKNLPKIAGLKIVSVRTVAEAILKAA